jgi:hypothetical protein
MSRQIFDHLKCVAYAFFNVETAPKCCKRFRKMQLTRRFFRTGSPRRRCGRCDDGGRIRRLPRCRVLLGGIEPGLGCGLRFSIRQGRRRHWRNISAAATTENKSNSVSNLLTVWGTYQVHFGIPLGGDQLKGIAVFYQPRNPPVVKDRRALCGIEIV